MTATAKANPIVLTRGDRVANFALHDAEGVERLFYLEVSGGPILLFACDALSDPEALAQLHSLQTWRQSAGAPSIDLFVVCRESQERAKAVLADQSLDCTCLCDPQPEILPMLLTALPHLPSTPSAAPRYATYLLDHNQRILAIFRQGEIGAHGERAAAVLAKERPPDVASHRLASVAPVLTLTNVFEPEFCRELIDVWAADHQEGGVSDGTQNLYDPMTKQTLEHQVLDPDLHRQITRRLARRIGPELVKVFQFNQPYRFEGYQILSYMAGRENYFSRHRDNVRATQQRRFAVSLNLNDDFEGGELYFPEYPPHSYAPQAGGAVVFSCHLLHEARPVTRGQRWVLVTFLCDPDRPSGVPGRP